MCHQVDQRPISEPVAETRLLEDVRRIRHRLHPAGDDDLVVAPYATALAAQVCPATATENLRALERAVRDRVAAVLELVVAFQASRDLPAALLAMDDLFDRKRYAKYDAISYIEENLVAPPAGGRAAHAGRR